MATAQPVDSVPTSKGTNQKEDGRYERIVNEPSGELEKEINAAKDFLDYALINIHDEDSITDEEILEFGAESKKRMPEKFQYLVFLAEDEDLLERPIFKDYTGPVYWNDVGRDFIVDPNQPKENFEPANMANLVYHSLKPFKVYDGGDKCLTVGGLCEAVAKIDYSPGDHNHLENIDIQLREIDNKEVMTIIFYGGHL